MKWLICMFLVIIFLHQKGVSHSVNVGFWGGPGGSFWECNGDIRKIILSHGSVIDSLVIIYMKDGVTEQSIRFGGTGGNFKDVEIPLNDNEYLVTIKGAVGLYRAQKVVSSLTFVTNMRPNGIGPFGKGAGTQFSFPVLKGKIGGLFGHCNDYVDAIGISLVPDHAGELVQIGPWGGLGGKPWDYNGEVRKFQVASLEGVIVSITFNGSTRVGGNGDEQGNLSPEISLGSDEYLRSIKGMTGKHRNVANVLQTVSFVTNKKTYGPYGKAEEGALPFDAPLRNGKITGFTARDAWWVDAIAFKVATVQD